MMVSFPIRCASAIRLFRSCSLIEHLSPPRVPDRQPHGKILSSVISFGDGHHRCPGSYVAIQETDIFLQRLLALDTLHIVHQPSLSWNDLVRGYENRDFMVGVEKPGRMFCTWCSCSLAESSHVLSLPQFEKL